MLPSLLVPLFVIALVLASFFFYQRFSRFHRILRKIPGPPGPPIFGNLFFYSAPREKLFEGFRSNARNFWPIYREWALHVGIVTINDPRDLEVILSSPRYIKKSKIYDVFNDWLGKGLLTSTGKKWQHRRKILTPAFHFSVLREFVGILNENSAKFLRNVRSGTTVDARAPVIELTLNSIAQSAMGVTLDDSDALSASYKKAVHNFGELFVYRASRPYYWSRFPFAFIPKGFETRRTVKILHTFTRNIIKSRKDKTNYFKSGKKLAMLDLMLKAQAEGEDFTDEEIREEVDTFTFEGHDTTAMSLIMILLVLANQKKEQEDIRQEIVDVLGEKIPTYADLQELPYTERCLKECLRLYPGVPYISRDAEEDIETRTGYIIPKGAMIHIHIFDVHRNPDVYPDPEKFDPDRFLPEEINKRHPFAYIPFSAGPRNCIGQKFAILELKAALCAILRRFRLEPVTARSEVRFVADVVLRPACEIFIKFVPRK